jgi:L,D-transpeptidase ErfK/SrfK
MIPQNPTILLLLSLLPTLVLAAPPIELSHTLSGSQFEYTVQPGDYFISLAARFGESAAVIAKSNGLDYNRALEPGQRLSIDNRHIVPQTLGEGILINLPQRMLFFFREGNLDGAYPVGLGKPTWPTPTGRFRVVQLKKNPTWTVPISIQEEMRRENEVVQTKVLPGPDNPLGKYWIGLSIPGYGIHGTIAPASVYHFQSHGCIRLQPADVEALFPEVKVGTTGQIIYAPVLLAALEDGSIYLEVNRDTYHQAIDALRLLSELAETNHLADRIDWQKAQQVVTQHEGVARLINRQSETQ